MNYFKAQQPDPFIKKDSDMTPAKFGHLNHIINAISDLEASAITIPAAAVADAVDEPSAVIQLNALLASLRTAGIIAQ